MTSKASKQQLDEIQLPMYDFKPPETFRVQWASKTIQEEYEPRITRLSSDFSRAELLTVFNRERAGCIVNLNKEDLLYDARVSKEIRANSCYVYPMNYVPVSKVYSNAVQSLQPGEDYQVRMMVTNITDYPNMNNLGRILGYPECCIKFFENYWTSKGYRDLVPCMEGIQFIELDKNVVISDYYELANILLKGMGIRAVPHLPCSLKCNHTNAFAHLFLKYLPEASYKLLLQLLRLDTTYSSYHGYAEVKNKLFKNVFNSLPLGYKLEFTLKQLMVMRLNEPESHNGFSSKDNEARAHHEIINFIGASISNESRILDLGCGDSTLLRRIGELYPQAMLEGVEINKNTFSRILQGDKLIAFNQDLNEFVFDGKYSLVMIANQRLREMDEHEISKFVHNIKTSTKYLLVYDYSGDELLYPINFSRLKHTRGISRSTSMALYVPYKLN